jgi:hypothetical protein
MGSHGSTWLREPPNNEEVIAWYIWTWDIKFTSADWTKSAVLRKFPRNGGVTPCSMGHAIHRTHLIMAAASFYLSFFTRCAGTHSLPTCAPLPSLSHSGAQVRPFRIFYHRVHVPERDATRLFSAHTLAHKLVSSLKTRQ